MNGNIILTLSVVVVGCSLLATGCKKDVVQPREVVRPIKTFTYSEQGTSLKFSYPARVHADRTVERAFDVTGRLAELHVVRGQRVKKGQLLARLDQRDFINALNQAKATYDEAKATYERFAKAFETNAVAKQQVDEAMARMQVTQAQVAIQEKALSDSEIHADFDAVVADRYVDNFQNVTAKQPIMQLQDIVHLQVHFNVPEQDVARAGKTIHDDDYAPGKRDENLTVQFSAVGDRVFNLEIREFSTNADPVTQTYLVVGILPAPKDVSIAPGMTATVTWIPESELGERSPTIPTTALGGASGEKKWVFVLDRASMTVKQREVKIGQLLDGGQVELLSGLQDGETIAAAGAYLLADDLKVTELQ